MNIAATLLRALGWSVDITVPDVPQCIICVAPHTSNWDFVLGKLAYASVGRTAGFLMKSQWFVWPLGYFFRALGGIPVVRKNKTVSLTEVVTEKFFVEPRLHLAITPEGTRSRTCRWHTGFLQIALNAGVPVFLGAIDYEKKHIEITTEFVPTGNMEADLRAVKDFYAPFKGKYPDKFSTDDC